MATKAFMLQSRNEFSQGGGWEYAETPERAAELYCQHFEEPDAPITVTGAGGKVTRYEPSVALRVKLLLDRAKEWDESETWARNKAAALRKRAKEIGGA